MGQQRPAGGLLALRNRGAGGGWQSVFPIEEEPSGGNLARKDPAKVLG